MSSDLYTLSPTQIIMYTTQNCSDCRLAKAYLDANEISYVQVGLEDDQEATEFVRQVNSGYQSVPTIVFPDGSILVEPSLQQLRNKFVST